MIPDKDYWDDWYKMPEGLTLEEQREWCRDSTILMSGAQALVMAFGGTVEGVCAMKKEILEKRRKAREEKDLCNCGHKDEEHLNGFECPKNLSEDNPEEDQ